MIMAASSELLHHESSAKALLQVPGVIVRSRRSAKCERERVHNSRLFGTLSLLPSAVKSSTISVFSPLYVLHSLADESIIIPAHTLQGSFALPSYTPHCSRENVGTQSFHPVIRTCSGYRSWAETIFADWQ